MIRTYIVGTYIRMSYKADKFKIILQSLTEDQDKNTFLLFDKVHKIMLDSKYADDQVLRL